MDDGAAQLIEALRGAALIGAEPPDLVPLTGGVSCDVWKLETPSGPVVVKRPLPQLRVAALWEAPVERGTAEVRWLRRAQGIDPALVPEVLADFPDLHAFVLRFIPGCPVWKDELIAGRVDPAFAAMVGSGIARVHAATAFNRSDQASFPNQAMFSALRLDPFFLHAARQDAELAPALHGLVHLFNDHGIALVHGDVSPKNILVAAQGPVFLDAECATWGDPAFDLAFCTTHLLLKAVWLDSEALRDAAAAMVSAYAAGIDWEPPADFMARAGAYCAGLLLARIEGKSPAPYMTDDLHKTTVRAQARALLLRPQPLDALVAQWQRTL